MFFTKTNDHFLLLARQFGTLLHKGQSKEQAFTSIEKALGDADARAFTALKQLMDSTTSKVSLPDGMGPAKTLRSLLEAARKYQADRVKLFGEFYEKFLRFDAAQHIKNFDTTGLIVYISALLVILAVVISIYSIFVFPGFDEMFSESGSELPGLTKGVMTFITTFGPVVLLIFLLVIFFFGYMIAKTKTNLRRLKFFDRTLTWVPGFKNIALAFNDYLALNYLQMLITCGVTEHDALTEIKMMLQTASARTTIPLLEEKKESSAIEDPIGFAATLGNLNEEVDYQITRKRECGLEHYVRFKDTISIIALISVAVIIGTLIIAMYLPIFQMGEIIGG